MRTYKEIKKIASCVLKLSSLVDAMNEKYGFDDYGIVWETARLCTLTGDQIRRFRETGNETEDYFVKQSVGYLGDDFSGYLWFKTDVPGQYVKVYFEM